MSLRDALNDENSTQSILATNARFVGFLHRRESGV